MARIPFGVAAYTRDSALQPEVVCRNMIVEKDESGASVGDEYVRIQRPGLAVYQTLTASGTNRGLFRMSGVADSLAVTVIGTKVLSFNGTTQTSLGTVVNDGNPVQMVGAGKRLGIVSGGKFYLYADGVLQTIAMPDNLAVVSACGLAGYFFLGTASGVYYWLLPGKTDVDALDFAEAEQLPDNLVGMTTLRDDVFMFGTESVERWQLSGNADAVLYPSRGSSFAKGCISRDTIANFDNTVFWVGNDGIVYRADSGTPLRVSSTGIEERIRKRTGALSAFTYIVDGHSMYVLRIGGVGTWAFDVMANGWVEFKSPSVNYWRASGSCSLDGGTILVGDSDGTKIFTLNASISTDDGTVFERTLTASGGFVGHRVRNDSLAVEMGADGTGTLRLRWRDGNNGNWSNYRLKTFAAGSSVIPFLRLGAARQPVRTFEVSCVDNVIIRISGSTVNEYGAS